MNENVLMVFSLLLLFGVELSSIVFFVCHGIEDSFWKLESQQ